jgi:hypothetical protein
MAGRGEIPLLLPTAVTLHLIASVEGVGFEKALGETEGHGCVVTPGAAREIEGPAAEHVAHGGESAGAAELSRGCYGVADGEAQ